MMNSLKKAKSRRDSLVDVIILLAVSALLSIDITRLGNIYTIDDNIFPYYYNEVRYKYFVFALYGYNPWVGTIYSFDISNFLFNFPVYVFSYLPYSSVFFEFFLLSIGIISTYKLITDMLPSDNKLLLRIAGYSGALFFILNPQGAGGLTSSMLSSIYMYSFMPLLLYSIRKYFLESNFAKTIFWLFITVPIFFFEYYTSVPVYVLPFAVLLVTFFIFYSAEAIRAKHYIRVLIPLVLLFLYISIELNYLLSIYNSFTNPDFVNGSYTFWVDNAKYEGLALTLRGLNANFGLPQPSVYYFSIILVLIYSFVLITERSSRNPEAIFVFSELLLFTLLYSMPNVPFSSFWEELFFKFPVMVDLRTQYVIITPFQGFLMSITVGLGSYYLMRVLASRRQLEILSLILILLVIVGIGFDVLVNGSPSVVYVPQEFLGVSDFINQRTSYNSSVLILPVFCTEDSQSWYHGPSLFSLFLKPFSILGGNYYSISERIFYVINNVYYNIYKGNTSSNGINYVKNFFYLFNVKYIVVEKTAQSYGPLSIYSPSGLYSYHTLESGLENYTKANVINLVYDNSMYSVYSTGANSSIGFLAYDNYSIYYLLNSDNISKLLFPIQVIYVSPSEYILKMPDNEINRNNVIYLYLMIPYDKDWNLRGAIVVSHENYYGYNIFKIKIENSTIYLINSYVNNSLKTGLIKFSIEFVLPLMIASLIRGLSLSFNLKDRKLKKVMKYF